MSLSRRPTLWAKREGVERAAEGALFLLVDPRATDREEVDAVVHVARVGERILHDHGLLFVLVGHRPVELAQDGLERFGAE